MFEQVPDGFDVCSVFAIVEFITNCFALAALIFAIRSIAADIYLHGNFKFVLCMALSRTLLNSIRRSVANYLTLFWNDELSDEFLTFYRHASIFTHMLLAISMIFVAIERLVYTYNIAEYESRKTSACSLTLCAATVILASFGIAVFDKSVIAISFKFASPVFTLSLMALVYRKNRKRRHVQQSSTLDDKALAKRNMNSVELFLPPMICTAIFSVILGVMELQKYVTNSDEFEYKESVLNGFVGLSIAIDDLLTPSIAYGCHRMLKKRSHRRIDRELRSLANDPVDYFKQFEKAWKVNLSKRPL